MATTTQNQHRLSQEFVENQIFEMWDAIYHIPDNDPDKQEAINQALDAEARLRERFRIQEENEAIRYTKQDLLSFGEWMIGTLRQNSLEMYSKKTGQSLKQLLSQVNEVDFTIWSNLRSSCDCKDESSKEESQ